MNLTQAVVEHFVAFCAAFNIRLLDWQTEAFGAAVRREHGRFVYPLGGISAPRGDGKSWGGGGLGVWRLIAGRPGTKILSVALDLNGTEAILSAARAIVRSHPELDRAIEIRADSLIVPATGNVWTISSREHTASRGQHPDLVLYDEVGWARDDELFASLLAGQASVADPLMLVVSTVGRRRAGPLWRVKELAESGDPAVFWHHHSENRSPFVSADFIARQRRILLPGQFAREHQNQWIDGADALTNSNDVDFAMQRDRVMVPPGTPEELFVDLGLVTDPTVIAGGAKVGGVTVITSLETFQGSHEAPVQIAHVAQRLRDIAATRQVKRIRIESWQGVSAAQALTADRLPVELFTPTAKAHSEEWPVFVQLLSGRTIVLPKHERLRDELLNLAYEVGPTGVRVIDRGKIHQDHAVAVRGVVAGLQRPVWTIGHVW